MPRQIPATTGSGKIRTGKPVRNPVVGSGKLERSDGSGRGSENFTDGDIILAALSTLGGTVKLDDVEHLAMKAAELAPSRFRWRHFRDQIDLTAVLQTLRSLEKSVKGKGSSTLLVHNQDGNVWLLGPEGAEQAKAILRRLSEKRAYTAPMTPQQRMLKKVEKIRLSQDPAVLKALSCQVSSITKREAYGCFRIDDFSTAPARRASVERLIGLFAEEEATSTALRAVGRRLRDLGELS
mgnify:CR=1 FL=1